MPEVKPFTFADAVESTPLKDRAEKHAESYERRAEMAKAKGNRAECQRNKKLAKNWRRLAATRLPDDAFFRLMEQLIENSDVLLVKGEHSDTALLCLRLVLDNILTGLHGLALQKNKKAIACLLAGLNDAVARFETHSHREPEVYAEWAQNAFGIPGILSRNREKSDDNRQRKLLESLRQGENFPLKILPSGKRGKRWKYASNANDLAEKLRLYIEGHRLKFALLKLSARIEKATLPEWLEDAHKLPAFSPTSHREWSTVAWKILKSASPNRHPSKHPHLANNATKICNRVGDVDSIEDDEIRETLNQAFEVIATGTSARKRQKSARLS
jgi:hypothetical protein